MASIAELKNKIPPEFLDIAQGLNKAGFEAYFVGGCVRDLILNRAPRDWDITTNARPEQIIALFPHTYYENEYGTVGVVIDAPNEKNEEQRIVEVTPYRLESDYGDKRRPDSVIFAKTLDEDLK